MVVELQIDGPIVGFDKEQIENMTFQDVILQLLMMYATPDGAEAMKVFSLGCRIAEAKEQVELSGDDVELLKKVVKRDPPPFTAPVMGQVHMLLE